MATKNDLYLAIKKYISYVTDLDLNRIFPAYSNDVPMPRDNDYCVITLIGSERLSTPTNKTHWDGSYQINQDMQGLAQIDFYGKFAFERANAIITASRDIVSCDYLEQFGIQPLYCENARNMTYISGEKDYVLRYMTEMTFEYDVEVILRQQGFIEAKINKIITEL